MYSLRYIQLCKNAKLKNIYDTISHYKKKIILYVIEETNYTYTHTHVYIYIHKYVTSIT